VSPAERTPVRRWEQRRFVSCSTLILGLALPVTGVGNHLARHSEGPTADAGWVVAHVAIGSLFVLFAVWHAILNRRALVRYLRAKAKPSLPSREILAALVMIVIVLALALS
jgi:hypothetical protein